jgi:S-adenosylmethionine synthetase
VERAKEEDQGAGDQGMMFGYACTDTEDYMPLPLYLSHRLLEILADIRHNEPQLMPYLRPDAKSQFTIEYDADKTNVEAIIKGFKKINYEACEAKPAPAKKDVDAETGATKKQ